MQLQQWTQWSMEIRDSAYYFSVDYWATYDVSYGRFSYLYLYMKIRSGYAISELSWKVCNFISLASLGTSKRNMRTGGTKKDGDVPDLTISLATLLTLLLASTLRSFTKNFKELHTRWSHNLNTWWLKQFSPPQHKFFCIENIYCLTSG